MNNPISIGWFGVPGAPSYKSTKVHLVKNNKPLCGSFINKKAEYQWCSHGISNYNYLECELCKNIIRKIQLKSYNIKYGIKTKSSL